MFITIVCALFQGKSLITVDQPWGNVSLRRNLQLPQITRHCRRNCAQSNLVPRVLSYPPPWSVGRVGENPGNEVVLKGAREGSQ